MAVLYFRISSDWEQVVKLRNEITKLETQLKSFGKSTPETQIKQTEERLSSTRQEFARLTTEAAKAGAVMENDFKKKIYDASQTVNDLTSRSCELLSNFISLTTCKQRKLNYCISIS